jgi:hypothetical protein
VQSRATQGEWALLTLGRALARRRTEAITLLLTVLIYATVIRFGESFVLFVVASVIVGLAIGQWWSAGTAVGVLALGFGHPRSTEEDLLWELIVFGYLPLAVVLIAAGMVLRRLLVKGLTREVR